MRLRHAAGFIVLAAVAAAPLAAQRNEQTSEFKWGEQLASGRWVRIANLNGKITVGQASGDRVELVATKHWRRGNPDDVRIEARKDGDDIVICALYGRQNSCDDDRWGSSRNRRRGWDDNWNDDDDVWVDFSVLIPKAARVRTASVNGSTTITGATGEVNASTVNGEIRVESGAGPINASGVNGRIYARITGAAANAPMDFSTVNGSVVLEVPDNFGADVTMTSVNGGLESDFPLTVSGRIDPRHMTVHVGGSGGPRVTLSTVNGVIELRKR